MKPFECLTQKDKDLIEKYIKDYGPEYCDELTTPMAPLSYILRTWNENKENLFHIFGNKLVLEKEIEFIKPKGEIKNEIENLVYSNDFMRKFSDFLCDMRDKYDDYNNEGNDALYRTWVSIRHQICGFSSLADNRWKAGTVELILPNGKKFRISEGMKITKIIDKLSKEYNIHEGYEDFRISHSQILNQKKLKGTLCLSIAPIDYITMSDNDCGWESCMNWTEKGSYRQGTVEMMNSPMVVVAYLKSKQDMKFYDFKISNKKWRELIVVNESLITGIKGYPYQNDEILKIALEWLRGLCESKLGTYEEKLCSYDEDDKDCKLVAYYDDKKITIYTYTYNMYNDFGRCIHYGYFSKNLKESDHIEFNYSGPSQCMWCGNTNLYFKEEGDVICDNCEERVYCYKCDHPMGINEGYEVDGVILCPCCYEYETCECAFDKKIHLLDDCLKIKLYDKVRDTISNYIYVYCKYVNLHNKTFINKYAKKYFKKNEIIVEYSCWFSTNEYIVEKENLTEAGRELFDF